MENMVQEQGVLTPEDIKAKLMQTLPQNMQQVFQRVIVAGQKIMYDDQAQSMAMAEMKKEGDPAFHLGKVIAALIMMMWQKSNGTLPPEIIPYAILYLMAEATDFLNQAGTQITKEQVGDATEYALAIIMRKFKIDQATAQKLASQIQAGGQPQGQQTAAAPQTGLMDMGA